MSEKTRKLYSTVKSSNNLIKILTDSVKNITVFLSSVILKLSFSLKYWLKYFHLKFNDVANVMLQCLTKKLSYYDVWKQSEICTVGQRKINIFLITKLF